MDLPIGVGHLTVISAFWPVWLSVMVSSSFEKQSFFNVCEVFYVFSVFNNRYSFCGKIGAQLIFSVCLWLVCVCLFLCRDGYKGIWSLSSVHLEAKVNIRCLYILCIYFSKQGLFLLNLELTNSAILADQWAPRITLFLYLLPTTSLQGWFFYVLVGINTQVFLFVQFDH